MDSHISKRAEECTSSVLGFVGAPLSYLVFTETKASRPAGSEGRGDTSGVLACQAVRITGSWTPVLSGLQVLACIESKKHRLLK